MEQVHVERRWFVGLVTVFLILGIPGLGGTGIATAQLRETVKPVQIVQIYGRDTLEIGELETFRVRVNAPYETAYRWKISDGAELGGNPIVYRFKDSGLYTLIATAVNPTGRDVDTLEVYVRPKKIPPPPLATREKPHRDKSAENEGPVDQKKAVSTASAKSSTGSGSAAGGLKGDTRPTRSGYTWVIATYFRRTPAEALANSYRAVGFRSSVIVDTGGKGSTVFRVTLGQFDSEQKALEAKDEVLRNGITNPLLHNLGGA